MQLLKMKKNDFVNAGVFFFSFLAITLLLLQALSSFSNTLLLYMGVILVGAFFAAWAQVVPERRISSILLLIAFFGVFFVFAFRDATAIDDKSYLRMFNNVRQNGVIGYYNGGGGVEIGYIALLWLIGLFSDEYVAVQIVTAIVPFLLFYISFLKLKKEISWFVSFYLFCTCFYFQMLAVNLSRMFIAVSIIVFAINYLLKDKKKAFCICVLIAALFHISSLFLLILLFFSGTVNRIEKRRWLLYFGSIAVLLIISLLIVPLMSDRYDIYSNIKFDSNSIFSHLTRIPLVLLFAFFEQYVRDETAKKKIKMMHYVFIFAVFIDLSGLLISFGRLVFFFDMFFVFGISMLYKKIGRIPQILMLAILCFYGGLYVYVTQFTTHMANLFPYNNICFI